MGSEAKIHLSKLETKLINNKEWILTKHTIINKVYQLLGVMNEIYKKVLEEDRAFFPGFHKNTAGKISRGENYEGLPYVMLDYPASFSKKNVFAVRTMFWWGNFFSITLHVSGEIYKLEKGYPRLLNYLKENNFFVCVNEREWCHNFEVSNYIPAIELDPRKFEKIATKNFFKISKNLKLNEWDQVPEFLEKTFKEIIYFAKISFPGGEKALSPAFPKADSDL